MLFIDAASVLSVTQVSRYLKELLDTDEILQDVWVRGEISGCRTYPSGHCYFTLKDAEAQLPCVFFKNARMRSSAPELRDGMAIAANGHISLYERDGKMQLYVENVELIGEGALFLRFEQLKARLEAEGLFDAGDRHCDFSRGCSAARYAASAPNAFSPGTCDHLSDTCAG